MISFLTGPSVGFGLAPIKQEGMCFNYEYPDLSWDGLRNEFETYFNKKYHFRWPIRWLIPIFRNIVFAAWNEALFANAKLKKNS